MITVRVPATTANLGPGFDCLGLALSLYARFSFAETEAGLDISGCPPEFRGEDNLAVRACRIAQRELGLKPAGLRLAIDSGIPPARGLGSSAACAAAGVLAAARLGGVSLSEEDAFQLVSRLEGHPDNAAPAVFGGLQVSVLEEGKALSLPAAVHPSLRFLALVPDFPLPTKQARAALPAAVSREDAVYNLSRAALLLRALETGDPEALRAALKDRLHQPWRFPLVPGAEALAARVTALGADGCFLSGAGPTLMCVYRAPGFSRKTEELLSREFPRFSAVELAPCAEGAVIERSQEI